MKAWQGKRILVTGGAGFIGSHLVDSLSGFSGFVNTMQYLFGFNPWGWIALVASLLVYGPSRNLTAEAFCCFDNLYSIHALPG